MTTIQTVTARLDHRPSWNHQHIWRFPYRDGAPEQCGYHMCQALSVVYLKPDEPKYVHLPEGTIYVPTLSHIRWNVKERLRGRYQGPPIRDEVPSDVCIGCGGYNPCNQPFENSS